MWSVGLAGWKEKKIRIELPPNEAGGREMRSHEEKWGMFRIRGKG